MVERGSRERDKTRDGGQPGETIFIVSLDEGPAKGGGIWGSFRRQDASKSTEVSVIAAQATASILEASLQHLGGRRSRTPRGHCHCGRSVAPRMAWSRISVMCGRGSVERGDD